MTTTVKSIYQGLTRAKIFMYVNLTVFTTMYDRHLWNTIKTNINGNKLAYINKNWHQKSNNLVQNNVNCAWIMNE